MFEHLSDILNRYDEISMNLGNPETIADQDAYRKLAKEFNDMSPLAEKIRERFGLLDELSDAEAMLADKPDRELREYLVDEAAGVRSRLDGVEQELRVLLLPTDPKDEKSVIIEIRPAAGGDEAALFAGVLYSMYGMYAEQKG